MWFSLPEGCGGITVERQAFAPEFTDEEGKAYFRAPDHFAPRILALKGFAMVEHPTGAPDDLPKSDPLRDNAIVELTRTLEARDIEIGSLRSDLGASTAKIQALSNENAELRRKLEETTAKLVGLEEELEDRPLAEMGKKK